MLGLDKFHVQPEKGLQMNCNTVSEESGKDLNQVITIDELTVKSWDGDSWETEMVEGFEIYSGYAQEALTHDAAGNLSYDGLHKYTYDAWNRLTLVNRAWFCELGL